MRWTYTFLFSTLAIALLLGCRKKDLSDYPGYVDLKHVRLFARPGEWWEGHDVVEMPDGRYAATGVSDFAGDKMNTVIVLVSPSGESLAVHYIPHRARGTNIVALDNERVAVKNRFGIHIFSLSKGKIERTIDLGYNREIVDENDVMLYDKRSRSFLVLWESDEGLCLRQVFEDRVEGWMACSGIDALPGAVKDVGDGYVIAGDRKDGVLLFKVDTLGDTVWVRKVELPFADGRVLLSVRSVEVAENGDILVAVENSNERCGCITPTVVRVDTNGNIRWMKDYYSPGDSLERFGGYNFSIVKASDNTYMLFGNNTLGGDVIGMVKIDGNGNVIKARNYFWAATHRTYNFIRTSDGNIVIVGACGMDSTDYFFLFKIDPEGRPVW